MFVIDTESTDILLNQAIRQIGQQLPDSMVFAVHARSGKGNAYRRGRHLGVVDSLDLTGFTIPGS